MNSSISQKVISLFLLLVIGFLLKHKFQDPKSTNGIKAFILNLSLPASIFLSTIDIEIQIDLIILPLVALVINTYLMIIGIYLSKRMVDSKHESQRRTLTLLFPSLAPGLTIYPFLEQFSGKQGLALAALADMGNKTFVLVGLYGLAIYWYRKSIPLDSRGLNPSGKNQWKEIFVFLLTEPVNITIIVAFMLALGHLNSHHLPPALLDTIDKLAICSTPLILIYVGLSLNLKSIQFSSFIKILMVKSGAGFIFSYAALVLLHPSSPEMTMLLAALPQASFSFWPLLHASRINALSANHSVPIDNYNKTVFFDTDYATSLLALSFPFSILVLLIIFANGKFLSASPEYFGLIGVVVLAFCGGISYPLAIVNPPLQKLYVAQSQPISRKDYSIFTRQNKIKKIAGFILDLLLQKTSAKQGKLVSLTKATQPRESGR